MVPGKDNAICFPSSAWSTDFLSSWMSRTLAIDFPSSLIKGMFFLIFPARISTPNTAGFELRKMNCGRIFSWVMVASSINLSLWIWLCFSSRMSLRSSISL